MEDTLATIVRENITRGPRDIYTLALSTDIDQVPRTIAQKHALDQDDAIVIKNAIILVLGNILAPQDVSAHLCDVLGLETAKAQDIAEELDMKLFAKVRPSIDHLYANAKQKSGSFVLPPPPAPPPGARRIIPTHTIISSRAPSPSYRPVAPSPSLPIQRPQNTAVTLPTPPSTTPIQPKQPVEMKKVPFNTPRITSSPAPTPPPHTTSTSTQEFAGDILSAKLSKPVNNPSTEEAIGSKTSRTYTIDPYREPAE